MVTFVGSSGPTSSGNFTSTAISGLAAGDLMFLAFSDDGETSQAGLSADWTEIYDVTSPVGTTSACALHYRIATGTAADAATYDDSVWGSAVVFAFRSGTGTFDFTPASDVAWSATVTRTPGAVSNDDAANTAVIIAHVQDTITNPTLPSGFTSTGNDNTGSGGSASSTTVGHKIGGLSTPTEAPGEFTGVSSSPYFLRCTTILLREGSSGITGSAGITEAPDSASGAGSLSIAGAAALVEGADTAAGAGALSIEGAGAVAEANDIAGSAASLSISASASLIESADSLSASGGPTPIAGTAELTEGNDNAASTATLDLSASADIAEAGDTVSSGASLSVAADADLQEAGDSAASSAQVSIGADAAITEAGDVTSASGALSIEANANLTEAGDSLSAEGSDPTVSTAPYVGSTVNPANQTAYTFAGHAIGDAASARLVVVIAHGYGTGAAARTVTGLTIGGVAATQVIGPSAAFHTSIWQLPVAAGTTADIAVTFSGAMDWASIDVYALTGLSSNTATDSDTDTGAVLTLALTTGVGDVVIAGATTDTFTGYSAGVSIDDNTAIESAKSSAGHGTATGTTTTVTGDGVTSFARLVAASWGVLATIEAAADITEAGDSVSSTAAVDIAAAADIAETGDSTASTAALAIDADAALIEAGDGVSSTATVDIAASATITETGDSAASTATLGLSADLSVTEAGDAASATAAVDIAADASAIEVGDTADAAATLLIEANANITEAGDGLSAAGSTQTTTTADADITEAGDTVSATASLTILADAAIVEAGDSVSAIIERVYAVVANRRIRFIAETPGARTIEFVTANLDDRPIIFVEPSAPRIIEWVTV